MTAQQAFGSSPTLISRAGFASAAGAATKEGSDAKKEAKKSVLESVVGAVKVIVPTSSVCTGVW